MDIFSVEKRSEIMSRIKSKNTGPELKVAAALDAAGIRYDMHGSLIGKPDFVFPQMGIILFVDGEFWHGHTLTDAKRQTLSEFWVKKLERNMERDKEVNMELKRIGWHVIRVTDREVNKTVSAVISRVKRANGQLMRKTSMIDPVMRIAALRDTLNQPSTKLKKSTKRPETQRKLAVKKTISQL